MPKYSRQPGMCEASLLSDVVELEFGSIVSGCVLSFRYQRLFTQVMMNCLFCLLFRHSQFTVTGMDGLKLKNRAARFADTLGSAEPPKPRVEPLTLMRQNVSFIIVLSVHAMYFYICREVL